LPTPYPIGPVTVYLLRGDPLTLVDTGPGTAAARQAIRAAFVELGVATGDIRRVLITHGHHDHYGQARWLARAGATLHAHPFDRRNLGQSRKYGRLVGQLLRSGFTVAAAVEIGVALFILDRTAPAVRRFVPLAEGDEIPHERGPIRVLHLPGHTPGHVGFELADSGVIITGDTVLDGLTPNAVLDTDPERPGQPFLSLAAYAHTLAKLEARRPKLLLPAHGPCIGDVSAQVGELRAKQEERAGEILARVSDGPVQVDQLIRRLFPHIGLVGRFLAFSEVYGHLLELQRRGLVRRATVRRREQWSPASHPPSP
jgi:glyoxylase-like metal-dependent hydrolase (beta-lactamase superfamily II)